MNVSALVLVWTLLGCGVGASSATRGVKSGPVALDLLLGAVGAILGGAFVRFLFPGRADVTILFASFPVAVLGALLVLVTWRKSGTPQRLA